MKTSKDPRHLQRIKIMQEIFASEFNSPDEIEHQAVKEILKKQKEIDEEIQKAAPSWPIEKINKIDLAILRLAAYELLIVKDTPPKVVVDEAVEIAKQYGSESSAGFINGALGKLISDNQIET